MTRPPIQPQLLSKAILKIELKCKTWAREQSMIVYFLNGRVTFRFESQKNFNDVINDAKHQVIGIYQGKDLSVEDIKADVLEYYKECEVQLQETLNRERIFRSSGRKVKKVKNNQEIMND